ncbi:MAG: adenylate/guanylate cyclase domain-containing protein [Chloroflexota bacterium]
MVNYRQLEHAIAVIETQRDLLGDEIVDLSLNSLREKLTALQNDNSGKQYSDVTVLVADISGFTKMSEVRDAELVRETINAVWQRLDHVIESWGGTVDKHVGDAVIALFGVPVSREDDPERAIQAALDMQMELTLINERMRQRTGQTHFLLSTPKTNLGMRIALHRGPVFFGRVGTSDEITAVGEAVNIANQLEKMAPVQGVLVSEDVYQHVQSLFEVEPLDPIVIEGKSALTYLYVIMRERARPFHMSIRGIEGVRTRIVGRTDELQQLQDIMQETIDSGLLRVMTIEGSSGIGKSRLLYEFEQLINLLPERIQLFRGRVHQEVGQTAYTLFRDLFSNHFDIHHRNSPVVAREKLVRGVVDMMDEDPTRAQERAHFMGQLLGFDFLDSPFLQGIEDDAQQIRETAFHDIVEYFTAVTNKNSIAILFLEDVHWADEGSFDLIDYLVQSCANIPMMIICLARPHLFEARPSWAIIETLNPGIYQRITLPNLSSIDSRHLALDILRNVSQMPMRLVDMIVTGAEGNPFYLEELVSMLIEWEVIKPGDNRWQVNMLDVPAIHSPLSLAGLLQMRLERLPDLERTILQKAAVLGQVFWDSLLIHLIQAEDVSVTSTQIVDTLYNLEKGAWIHRRKLSTIEDVQEYAFRHDSLRVAIYESIPEEKRLQDHAQTASWFATNRTRYENQFTPVVAYHFAQAQDNLMAGDWFNRAAEYARSAYMPETSIYYYRQALTHLSSSLANEQTDALLQKQLVWNEGLAEMLRIQARFGAAIDAYSEMIGAAEQIKDDASTLRGLVAYLKVVSLRGNADLVTQTAVKIETLARQNNAPAQVALGLVGKAWAYVLTDRISEAIPLAREALTLSQTTVSMTEVAFSQTILANIARLTNHPKQAGQLLRRATKQFQLANERLWEGLLTANLAHLAHREEKREIATSLYQESLRMAREIGDFYLSIISLRKLGLLAQYEGIYNRAEQYFQQALIMAERSHQRRYQAMIANDLGDLYLDWGSATDQEIFVEIDTLTQQAYIWLHKAVRTSEEAGYTLILAQSLEVLSRLQLIEKNEEAAKKSINRAIGLLADAKTEFLERTPRNKKQELQISLNELLAHIESA